MPRAAARLVLSTLAASLMAAAPSGLTAREHVADPPQARPLTSLANLAQQARDRVSATPRVALDASIDAKSLGSPEAPAFVRALGGLPASIQPMAALPDAVLFKGTIAPEIKAAMGLRIAQVNGSPYVASHMLRVLTGHDRGGVLRSAMEGSSGSRLSAPEQVALRYAEMLTRTVNLAPGDFERVAATFNDSEIVELTMTVSFFNFFTRYAEGLNLPVERWALDGTMTWPAVKRPAGVKARIALLADDEITAAAAALAQSKDPAVQQARNSLGLGMANSQRAMLRVPGIQQAWRAFGSSFRDTATIGRDILLQVSFAVSTANECRYCTLHQVQGLRRLGVDPIKLQAMRKDDAALTPRELAAVKFARKLTDRPAGISDGDYAALKKEFGEAGALEVLIQTCNFAFMNRFTDGLQLPSEDEAIKVYHETYGATWAPATSQP
jgi:AhpD family alkylhydroperoxidase